MGEEEAKKLKSEKRLEYFKKLEEKKRKLKEVGTLPPTKNKKKPMKPKITRKKNVPPPQATQESIKKYFNLPKNEKFRVSHGPQKVPSPSLRS